MTWSLRMNDYCLFTYVTEFEQFNLWFDLGLAKHALQYAKVASTITKTSQPLNSGNIFTSNQSLLHANCLSAIVELTTNHQHSRTYRQIMNNLKHIHTYTIREIVV